MVKTIHSLLLVLILVSLVATKKLDEKAKIVDANHFQSEQIKQKIYDISKIKIGKPIVLIIESVESDLSYENKISAKLKQGDTFFNCSFQSSNDLCIVESATANSLELTLTCDSLPCEIQWDISQPKIGDFKDDTKISQLYKVEETSHHAILLFTCNNVEIENFQKYIHVLSNNKYLFQENQGNIHYLFNSLKKGYIFIKTDSKIKTCLEMRYNIVPTELKNQFISDFVLEKQKIIYDIKDIPSKSLRIECMVRIIEKKIDYEDKNDEFNFLLNQHEKKVAQIEKKIELTVTGEFFGKKFQLRKNEINLKKSGISKEFNVIVPKIDMIYGNIKVQISSMKSIFIDIMMSSQEVQIIEPRQYSYFSLKKGQKIQYELQAQQNIIDDEVIHVYPSDEDNLRISKLQCFLRKGCEFQVEAQDELKGYIYLGSKDLTIDQENQQILPLDFGNKNTFTRRIHEGEKIYIKKKLESMKSVQVVVNSQNVVIYAADIKKCPYPSSQCFDNIGSLHDPFIYQPQNNQTTLMINIKGLDFAFFTITIIEADNKEIELKDGQPFSYSFNLRQEELLFSFFNPQKETVSFNLIAPVNQLLLLVKNSKEFSQKDVQEMSSTEGFIIFETDNIKDRNFSIVVKRRNSLEENQVHFTLIASTKNKYIRIQPSITYYETLNKNSTVKYVFEFNAKSDYILNFYTQNAKSQNIDIQLQLSAQKIQNDEETLKTYRIDQASDALSLTEVSEELCLQEGESEENCEIFIQLKNRVDAQIDIAITLMTLHTLIELRNGIWQTFALNTIAETSHFYFIPSHSNSNINIIYKSSQADLRLAYKIFNDLDGKILPDGWPFPSETPIDEHETKHSLFKPSKAINIHREELKDCGSSCVILMSLVSFSHQETKGNFVIMATNSILELPEKQKIDVVVKAKQIKSFLIDLKYALKRERDVIVYVSTSLGMVNVYANVYSNKNQRAPVPEDYDFKFDGEYVIQLEKIQQKLTKYQMNSDNNKYLYLIVEGEEDAKLSLEYDLSSGSSLVKMLNYDTFQTVRLEPSQVRYYHLSTDQQYMIKIVRRRGYPYVRVKVCKDQTLESCVQGLKNEEQKGEQIVKKTHIIKETPCTQCVIVCKVQSVRDPSQLDIHIQSKYSDIELLEGQSTMDFTVGIQPNRYTVYGVKDEQIVINIKVNAGQVIAELTDLGQLNKLQKSNSSIKFVVSPEYFDQLQAQINMIKTEQDDLLQEVGQERIEDVEDKEIRKQLNELQEKLHGMNAPSTNTLAQFGSKSKFIALHVSIISANIEMNSQYTITYTSGVRQIQLEDGLIFDAFLEPNKPQFFQYTPEDKGHAFLMISAKSSQVLSFIDIKMESCDHDTISSIQQLRLCWKQFPAQIPPMNRKGPHPTIISALPPQNDFRFTFLNKGYQPTQISLGINHEEVILLPYELDFPFLLHPKEHLNLIVQVKNPGHFLIVVRICDASEPTFSYTFKSSELSSNDFSNEIKLEDPKHVIKTKTQKPGSLYLHAFSPQSMAFMSVKVLYSEKKFLPKEIKVSGTIKYMIKNSNTVVLSVNKPKCMRVKCQQFRYTIMIAKTMQDLYSHLACPSSFFSTLDVPTIPEKQLIPVEIDGGLSFEFQLTASVSYIGIKVTEGEGQGFYKPIEVMTLWGQLSRISGGLQMTMVVVAGVVVLGILWLVRGYARRGYKKIDSL